MDPNSPTAYNVFMAIAIAEHLADMKKARQVLAEETAKFQKERAEYESLTGKNAADLFPYDLR